MESQAKRRPVFAAQHDQHAQRMLLLDEGCITGREGRKRIEEGEGERGKGTGKANGYGPTALLGKA